MSPSSSSLGMFDALLETAIEVIEEVEQMIDQLQQENAENACRRKRRCIQRFREVANERLMQDYFVDDTTFIGYYFCCRFRIHKSMFLRIVNDVMAACLFFQ